MALRVTGSLAAATVENVELDVDPDKPQDALTPTGSTGSRTIRNRASGVAVVNASGDSEIYFTVDGSTPTVGGVNCFLVAATIGARTRVHIRVEDTITVKMISAGVTDYHVGFDNLTPSGFQETEQELQSLQDQIDFIAAPSLASLTDVDLVTDPQADSDVLAWDQASGKWMPATVVGGGGSQWNVEIAGAFGPGFDELVPFGVFGVLDWGADYYFYQSPTGENFTAQATEGDQIACAGYLLGAADSYVSDPTQEGLWTLTGGVWVRDASQPLPGEVISQTLLSGAIWQVGNLFIKTSDGLLEQANLQYQRAIIGQSAVVEESSATGTLGESSSGAAVGFSVVNASGGSVTRTLTDVATSRGHSVIFVKSDASTNEVVIDAAGTETINGSTSPIALTSQWGWVRLTCSGTEWVATSGTVDAATTSNPGIVELATTVEAIAGTDTDRAVTPEGLKAHTDAAASATPTIDDSGVAGPLIIGTDGVDGSGTTVSILSPVRGEPGDGVSIPKDWIAKVTVPMSALAGLIAGVFPPEGATALVPGPSDIAGVYQLTSDGSTVTWTLIPYPAGTWAYSDIPISATETFRWVAEYNGDVWRTVEPGLPELRGEPERGQLLDTFTSGPALFTQYPGDGTSDNVWTSNDPSIALPLGLDVRYDVRFLPGVLDEVSGTDFYHEILAILDPGSSGGDLLEIAATQDDGTQYPLPPDRLGTFAELRPNGAPGEVPDWTDLLWQLGRRIKGRTVWDIAAGEVRHYARAYMINDETTSDGRKWRLLYRRSIDPSINDATGLTWQIGGSAHFEMFEFQAHHGPDGTRLVNIDATALTAAVGTTTITCGEGTVWTTTTGSVLANAGILKAEHTVAIASDGTSLSDVQTELDLKIEADRVASETVDGIVELATTVEATTGTDTERAVTPAGLTAHVDSKLPTPVGETDGKVLTVQSDALVYASVASSGGASSVFDRTFDAAAGDYLSSASGPYANYSPYVATAGFVCWTAQLVPAGTYDRLGIQIATAGDQVIRLCVDSVGDNGYPETLLVDAGTVATASVTGLLEATMSWVNPIDQWVWVRVVGVSVVSGTTVQGLNGLGGNAWPPWPGWPSSTSAGRSYCGLRTTGHATGADEQPNVSVASFNSVNSPRVYLRKA